MIVSFSEGSINEKTAVMKLTAAYEAYCREVHGI